MPVDSPPVRITDAFTDIDKTPPNYRDATFDLTKVFAPTPRLKFTAYDTAILWLALSNTSDKAYTPGQARGYSINIHLIDQDTNEALADVNISSPGSARLPIQTIRAQRAIPIGGMPMTFATRAVTNGLLIITFIPEKGTGLKVSRIEKPVTITNTASQSIQSCSKKVGAAIANAAFMFVDVEKIELAVRLLAVITKSVVSCDDVGCILDEFNTELTLYISKKIVSGSKFFDLIEKIGDTVEFFKEVSKQEQDYRKMTDGLYYDLAVGGRCIDAAAWLNSFVKHLNTHNLGVNTIFTESPVYPLVTNAAGQQAGFLSTGEIVQTVPDSYAAPVGEGRLIVYQGLDPVQVQIVGYAQGTMNLHLALADNNGSTVTESFRDVSVTPQFHAQLDEVPQFKWLEVDADGNGKFELAIARPIVLSPEESSQFTRIRDLILTDPLISGVALALVGVCVLLGWQGWSVIQARKRTNMLIPKAVAQSEVPEDSAKSQAVDDPLPDSDLLAQLLAEQMPTKPSAQQRHDHHS